MAILTISIVCMCVCLFLSHLIMIWTTTQKSDLTKRINCHTQFQLVVVAATYTQNDCKYGVYCTMHNSFPSLSFSHSILYAHFAYAPFTHLIIAWHCLRVLSLSLSLMFLFLKNIYSSGDFFLVFQTLPVWFFPHFSHSLSLSVIHSLTQWCDVNLVYHIEQERDEGQKRRSERTDSFKSNFIIAGTIVLRCTNGIRI